MIRVILGLLLCVTLPMSTLSAVEVKIILVEEVEGSGTSQMGPGFSTLPDTNFSRTRYNQTVRLNRRNNVMSPTGVFTCEVPNDADRTMNHTATITISECSKAASLSISSSIT